jgi:hypothetical protein
MVKDTGATKSDDKLIQDKDVIPTMQASQEADAESSETIPVETQVGITWRYPPGITPRTEFVAAVENAVLAQIPEVVRNSWKIGDFPLIKVDASGHKLQATIREYVEARLQTVNQKRPSLPVLSLTGGNNASVASVRYVWAGGGRVCVNSYALNMGEELWQVTGDENLDPPAQMEFQVGWVWDPET